MDFFLSLMFKIILTFFVFIVIYKIFLYIVMSRLMKQIVSSTDEEKSKIIRSFSKPLPIYKILFWMAPINLIFIPVIIYFYARDSFVYFLGMLLMMYVVILEDYFYRKTILRSIDFRK